MLRLFKKTPDGLEEFDLLEGSINIPLTTAQTNPTNPTKYITEYSKSVTLPLTPHNLQLMDFYTEMDSVILSGRYTPVLPLEVVVCNDNDIIFEGKLKLEKVNDYKGNRNMECTLYGKMNDFFNIMLNTTYWYDSVVSTIIGYDNNNEPIVVNTPVNTNGMHVLDNTLDTGYNICKETVLESWRTQPYGYTGIAAHIATLNPVKASTYNPTSSQSHSIIAWAPTEQGSYNNFISDKVIVRGYTPGANDTYNMDLCRGGTQDGVVVDIVGTTKELRYITITEDNRPMAEAVIGDGITERQWCQYRSYYQKPTVYVNHIWQTYKNLSEELTGLKLELDSEWFNTSNTRYTDLVYTLPDLQQEQKKNSGGDSSTSVNFANVSLNCHDYAFGTSGAKNGIATITGTSTAIQNGHIVVPAYNTGYYTFKHKLGIYIKRNGSLRNSSSYSLCYGDGLSSCIDLQVAFRNVNDSTEVNTYNFKITDENDNSWTSAATDTMLKMGTNSWADNPQTIYFTLEGEVLIGQNNTNADKEYEMVLSVYCQNGNIDGGSGKALFQSRGRIANINALAQSGTDAPMFTFSNLESSIKISEETRSEFPLEMKNLFPANWSPFNILLQYTKLFNLVWDYNQLEGKVTVMTREKWFSLHQDEILDWTNKIDRGREFSFKPLAWDKKYVLFNYDDVEMDWLDTYKSTYNVPYGSKRITTQYKYNNETEELFCTSDSDTIAPSVMVSSARFPLQEIVSTSPTYQQYLETFIGNRKDNKAANIWGQFFFRNNLSTWDSTSGKINVLTDCNSNGDYALTMFRNMGISIVDDTKFQVRRNIFAVDMTVYSASMDRRVVVPSGCRPVFSTYDKNGEHCCIMSKPAMTFYNEQAPEMYKTITVPNPISPLRPLIVRIQFVDLVPDVYTERWSNIIQEQYNEQNKLLTCYVKLKDMDFRNLTCNRFVRIGDVLYSIYKVDDFKLGIGGMTKVELLQVWDMKKYLGQYYVEPTSEPLQ